MDIMQIMRERHSVRQYTDAQIPKGVRARLVEEIDRLNGESGLHMQLFFDEPECFRSALARYGMFTGVRNYMAIVGRKGPDLEEKAGYYGQTMVLLAQSLGLNSCWVGLNHGKTHVTISPGEKQVIVVALGYGETQGVPHQTKPAAAVSQVSVPAPDWFKRGIEAALLAPTAVNQQKFLISYDGTNLAARVNGRGFFAKVDLGIVKCHFELASGHTFNA